MGATSTGIGQSFATTPGTEYVVTFYILGYPASTATDEGEGDRRKQPGGNFHLFPNYYRFKQE